MNDPLGGCLIGGYIRSVNGTGNEPERSCLCSHIGNCLLVRYVGQLSDDFLSFIAEELGRSVQLSFVVMCKYLPKRQQRGTLIPS